ncbi:MAG: pilin [Patescibacteria group bacterium]|nr:pilin [Patescibacteria group bacterium]
MNFQDFISTYCSSIQACLQGLFNLGVAIAILVAFFMFLFGAFKNLLSVVPDIKMEGKTMMRNAIIGLVVIFLSGIILYWINPFIFDPRIIVYRVTKLEINATLTQRNLDINLGTGTFTIAIPEVNFDRNVSQLNCQSEKNN